MASMAGRRKHNPLGLEPRVYAKHGAFYYVHRDGKWEKLGTEIGQANERARRYNDSRGEYGTIAYWLDLFIVDCEARVKAGTLAARTFEDYSNAIKGTDAKPGALRLFFAPPLTPLDLDPDMVQDYLETNAELGRKLLAESGLAILAAESLTRAAKLAVEKAQ
jgi:hypothetical protein